MLAPIRFGEGLAFQRFAFIQVAQQAAFCPLAASCLPPEVAPKDERVHRPCVVGMLMNPAADRGWKRVVGRPITALKAPPDFFPYGGVVVGPAEDFVVSRNCVLDGARA